MDNLLILSAAARLNHHKQICKSCFQLRTKFRTIERADGTKVSTSVCEIAWVLYDDVRAEYSRNTKASARLSSEANA